LRCFQRNTECLLRHAIYNIRVVHSSHFSLYFQTHFWLIFTLTCKNIKMSQK
jgi:hypothetical protein